MGLKSQSYRLIYCEFMNQIFNQDVGGQTLNDKVYIVKIQLCSVYV